MPRFYFTYGADPTYPFQGGWTEIIALDRPMACAIFQRFHPNREGSAEMLNCADVYSESQFKATAMYAAGENFGEGCHERISLRREIFTLESGGHAHED